MRIKYRDDENNPSSKARPGMTLGGVINRAPDTHFIWLSLAGNGKTGELDYWIGRERVFLSLSMIDGSRPVAFMMNSSSIPRERRFFATVSFRRIRGKGCPFPLFLELDVILSHHPARAYLYPTWATGKEEKFRDSLLLGVVF